MFKDYLYPFIRRFALLALLAFTSYATVSQAGDCHNRAFCESCSALNICQSAQPGNNNQCCTMGVANPLLMTVPMQFGFETGDIVTILGLAHYLKGRSIVPPLPPPRSV
jgi:hypothetical protein